MDTASSVPQPASDSPPPYDSLSHPEIPSSQLPGTSSSSIEYPGDIRHGMSNLSLSAPAPSLSIPATAEPSNAQILERFDEQSNRIFITLNDINLNLTHVREQNDLHAREIADLRATSVVQGDCLKMLDRRIQDLTLQSQNFATFIENHDVNNHCAQNQPIPQANIDVIAREIQERLSRSRNIVIFNLEEGTAELDMNTVLNIVRRCGVNTADIQMKRVGQQVNNRPRALIITLSSR